MKKIGIRREDKNIWERRVPLTPDHVKKIVSDDIQVVVQPSKTRAIAESEYQNAGAVIQEDLAGCQVVFAVKEIPTDLLQPNVAYVYFAHVIKGQTGNMPMLRRLLDLKCTLIDYEKVVDDKGRRLIFFGRHAGLAGMLDSLWALGKRLEWEGLPSPFSRIQPTHTYKNLAEAKQAVSEAAQEFAKWEFPESLHPIVFGFAGYGNVSQGAQEIFDLLPHEQVAPGDLPGYKGDPAKRKLAKVVFKEEHMVRPLDPGKPFDLQEYYDHPERFEGVFAKFVPHLTALINCIYWAPKYPKLITREQIADLWARQRSPRIRVFGDISCDVEGAVECNIQCTEPDSPVYVYQPESGTAKPGVEGNGPVVLAVDNLPCELPIESSLDFGDALLPFVAEIARADYTLDFEQLNLPAPIKRAVIAHRGALTPDYKYLSSRMENTQGGSK